VITAPAAPAALLRYLPAAALLASGFALALGLQTYGNKIALAPNAAAAAPYAAPFALLMAGTTASITLAAVSLCSVSPRKF
jgi:hypothetical protein